MEELEKEYNLTETKIKENLESQLYELEMLQSIFSNPGEFKLDDNSIAICIKKYISDESKTPPPFVDFTVNVNVNDKKYEICFNLSHEYPLVEPDVFIRNSDINKYQHAELNKMCNDFIATLPREESCVYSIISWLQENAGTIEIKKPEEVEVSQQVRENENFTRLWIYSHHIYNKNKRREILYLANKLELTGFCLPGKPGIICVEGRDCDCNEWWQTIRSMTWKRIVCKVTETGKNEFLKFKSFEEIGFQTSGARSNHMDMGEFYKYLECHELQHIFEELFGI